MSSLRQKYYRALQELRKRPQVYTLADLIYAASGFLSEDQLVFFTLQLKSGSSNMQGIRYVCVWFFILYIIKYVVLLLCSCLYALFVCALLFAGQSATINWKRHITTWTTTNHKIGMTYELWFCVEHRGRWLLHIWHPCVEKATPEDGLPSLPLDPHLP